MTAHRWAWLAGIAAVLIAVTSMVAQLVDRSTGSKPATQPRRQDNSLSLAGVAGANIVALTVIPPAPGRVRLHVEVVAIDPSRTKDINVRATSTAGASTSTRLHGCGSGCFDGIATLAGATTWMFTVEGNTSNRPFAVQLSAPLPAPDARTTLTNALVKMNHLRSVRVHETLRSRAGGPALETEYRFLAPNRFAYDQRGTSNASSVAIGKRRYERDGPSAAWQVGDWPDPAGFAWPANFYNAFWTPATAVRMLGSASLRGTPTHVIAFVHTDSDAWFRLWLGDSDGLVHRMEMRALSHVMNQDYDRFNQPVSIIAPRT